MLNATLLVAGPQWNTFTEALKQRCAIGGEVLVRMRNSDWVKVIYQPPVLNEAIEGFRTRCHSRIWDISGRSITSQEFDLVEI